MSDDNRDVIKVLDSMVQALGKTNRLLEEMRDLLAKIAKNQLMK